MELMTVVEMVEKLGLPYEQGRQKVYYLISKGKLTPARRTGKNGRIVLFDADQLPQIAETLSQNEERSLEDTQTSPNGGSL